MILGLYLGNNPDARKSGNSYKTVFSALSIVVSVEVAMYCMEVKLP
ncbi:hypothetical protein [Anaplasma phagocytophilum]|nr:hypothetical protein [Anaplasma phagocytophilum]SBO33172.1 hypothetical protein ANAPC3_01128 [Anaplasma phagocytophilum]